MRAYFFFLLCLGQAFSLSISPQDASKIGEKIWKNECNGKVEGLTSWNQGESFPSLGIGHFIWYPVGVKESFQETFPALLQFLSKNGASFPNWLKVGSECPWNCREDFYKDIESSKMKSLRQFLFETRSLQAVFIANRLEEGLAQIVESCSQAEKSKIEDQFHLLAKDANGLYALIDYLNFKGSGASSKESYEGEGWGLLQVLQKMPTNSKDPLLDFVDAAKTILKQRVENSPPERNEGRWLKGWFNRLDTYLVKRERIST